jgi:hypothetical protein
MEKQVRFFSHLFLMRAASCRICTRRVIFPLATYTRRLLSRYETCLLPLMLTTLSTYSTQAVVNGRALAVEIWQ